MNKRAEGIRPFVISLIVIVLFGFFLFSFVGNFIQSTNPNSEVLQSKYGLNQSLDRLNESIESFSSTSDYVYGELGGSKPLALEYTFLIFKGAFHIPYAFLSFGFTGISSIVYVIFPALAGTGFGTLLSVVTGLIGSVLLITIVFLIVKAIRTGESER